MSSYTEKLKAEEKHAQSTMVTWKRIVRRLSDVTVSPKYSHFFLISSPYSLLYQFVGTWAGKCSWVSDPALQTVGCTFMYGLVAMQLVIAMTPRNQRNTSLGLISASGTR